MSPIDAPRSNSLAFLPLHRALVRVTLVSVVALAVMLSASVAIAGSSASGGKAPSKESRTAHEAGQAASGELLFYPCASCHAGGAPTSDKAARPNGFERHTITLVVHDRLGKGSRACLVCHDDPEKDPGKLKLVDGSLVDIKGDVSAVCYRCHSDKYNEWKSGIHGKRQAKCSSSGCHDPHSPSWIYAEPLRPFTGTGFQVRAVSEMTPFTPLAPPPLAPPVKTPLWFLLAIAVGMTIVAGIVGTLISGRLNR